MCKKDYLLSNTIIFDSKPIAVPYNYRVSYKISQLALILSLCCSRGGCSLVKLHMISVALNSEVSMLQMERIADGILSELPVIRFDPAVNRALLFAISEGIIVQQKNGKLKLSLQGKKYVATIMKEPNLMIHEKNFLSKISTKITEDLIKEIMSNWRYQDATN